ncbi:MAG: hypothetical protein ABL921_05815 [Pirellula sp.]
MTACILGGIAGYSLLQRLAPMYPFANLPEMGDNPPAALVKQYHEAEYAFQSHNAAANCGLLGACIGLFLGLLTVNRRRILTSMAGGLGGIVGGVVAGYIVGQYVAYGQIFKSDQSLLMSTTYHLAVWASMAIGACLAICAVHPNLRQTGSALVSALVAGSLAALVYNIVCTTLYPLANLLLIHQSNANERLVWVASGAGLLGLVIGLGMRSAAPKTSGVQAS